VAGPRRRRHRASSGAQASDGSVSIGHTTTRPATRLGDERIRPARLVLADCWEDVLINRLLRSRASRSIPARAARRTGSPGPSTTRPIRSERPVRSIVAPACRWKPRSSMISRTAPVVRGGLRPRVQPRETRLDRHLGTHGATSAIVGRLGSVLRGPVGPLVRQRWHSPHYSGAERTSSTHGYVNLPATNRIRQKVPLRAALLRS
jgi:hypothetical protein